MKATVDAYTGKVKLYAWDTRTRCSRRGAACSPASCSDASTCRPTSAITCGIPQDLFEVQRAMLTQYHVDDPVTFYNVSDKWTVPDDPNEHERIAAAVLHPRRASGLDGGHRRPVEFQLTSPMNVNSSNYLAAYMSVRQRSQPENYGKITVLRVPEGDAGRTKGRSRSTTRCTTDSTITKDLTFFNSPGGGSTRVHGNLLTLPIGNSFLYVEPLYYRARRSRDVSGAAYACHGRMATGSGTARASRDALDDFCPAITPERSSRPSTTAAAGPTTTHDNRPPPPPSSGSSTPAEVRQLDARRRAAAASR